VRSRRFLAAIVVVLSSLAPIACERAPTLEPSASEPGSAPGRPYEAAEVLAAMRDSRRPGGVPDQLETDAIAAAVAERLWTWDGEPWDGLSIGGACGPEGCSLDVAGSPGGGAGTDLYSFSIDPAAGDVEMTASDLHGYPPALESELDAIARAALAADQLRGLRLSGGRWLPPPDEGRYWLAYRSGGEEGAPGVDVLLDHVSRRVIEVTPVR
jgi:hypothetical protein